jgi:nucleoside-diphosphate-sugar epimerase
VHLATCYGRNGESHREVVEANTLFPLALLEEAIRQCVPLFVSADTCFNTWPLRYGYLRSYTLSKRHFAQWGEVLAAEGPIRFLNVKLQHPYGPGDGPAKFVPQFIRDCLTRTDEIALTPGEQKKDFIFVDDVVSALRTLLDRGDRLPAGFSEYECGSSQATSIRAFAEMVHRLTNSNARLRFGALPYRENEIMFSQANIEALAALGWRPQWSLEQGLREVLKRDFGRA